MDAVRAGRVPEGVDLNSRHRAVIHPRHTGARIELTDAHLAHVAALIEAREARRAAEAAEENAKAILAEALGEAQAGECGGRVVVTWTAHEHASFDLARLRRERPDVATAYTTTTPIRTMRTLQ
jgi:hypothetical protein